jgi:hypothetical protein
MIKGKPKYRIEVPPGIPLSKESLFPEFIDEYASSVKSTSLLLETPFLFIPIMPLFNDIVSDFMIYDFDPRVPKKASPITGKADLDEQGNNLAIVLNNIFKDTTKKRKLHNFINDLLPFVKTIGVEKFADQSLMFKLQEIYCTKQFLPASLISDGTINITALIIALFFEQKPLTIIEEPERNIHPYLIRKLALMLKEASINKQIIVTTHNPELIKNTDSNEILLVARDKKGFTKISKPTDKAEIKTFLKNEIGLEELYVQNLL